MIETNILTDYKKSDFEFDKNTLTFNDSQKSMLNEFETAVISYFNKIKTVEDYEENEKVIKKIRALVNNVSKELDNSRLSEKKELTASIDRLASEIKILFKDTKPSIERLGNLESQLIEKFINDTNEAIDEYINHVVDNYEKLNELNIQSKSNIEGVKLSKSIIDKKIPKKAYNKISDTELTKIIVEVLEGIESDLNYLSELNPENYLKWYLESFDMNAVVLENRVFRDNEARKKEQERLANEPKIDEPKDEVITKPVVNKPSTPTVSTLKIKYEDLDKAIKILNDAGITVLTN